MVTQGGTGMNVHYLRCSTDHQSYQRQIEILKAHPADKIFEEKISGKSMDRPRLQEMLEFVREGDTVYVSEFSRLARSTQDLLAISSLLEHKKVALVSCKEAVDTSTPTGRLMMTMIAALAEFERETINERVRAGVAIAKAAGKYKGRQPVKVKDFASYYEQYLHREFTKTALAKELGISRQTLYRLFAEYEKSTEYQEKYAQGKSNGELPVISSDSSTAS